MKVFWSWQADRPQRVCRNLIKEALELAIPRAAQQLELDESERPEIDHDTKGVAGWVEIANTILKKIEAAAVFVGDVTYVAQTSQGKNVPNPNVLVELGYAINLLKERIVLVQNARWGGKPDDLPFDLRHRRAPITYNLDPKATPEEYENVKEALAAELSRVLAALLGSHLEEADGDTPIVGVPSRENDPSVWFARGARLEFRDYFGGAKSRIVDAAEGPRAYMRLIPAGWPSGKPDRNAVHNLPGNVMLWPLGRWQEADGGMNTDGVLRISTSRADGQPVWHAVQWFNASGEIWGFDSRAIVNDGGTLVLSTDYILKEWEEFLSKGIRFLQHFDASTRICVEAGVTALTNVHWPAQFRSGFVSALEPAVVHAETSRNWDQKRQCDFLVNLYNALRIAFGFEQMTKDQIYPPGAPGTRCS
jgi:hypothetical protein